MSNEILHRGRRKSSGKVHFPVCGETVPFFKQDVLLLSCRESKNKWQQNSQDSAHKSSETQEIFYCFRSVSGRRTRYQLYMWSWKASPVSAIVTNIEEKWFAPFFGSFCVPSLQGRFERKGNKVESVFNVTRWQLKARFWNSVENHNSRIMPEVLRPNWGLERR